MTFNFFKLKNWYYTWIVTKSKIWVMKSYLILIPTIIISSIVTSCTTSGNVYGNDRVYRSPDGGTYRTGQVYRDNNGNVYKNGRIIEYGNDRSYTRKSLPPGQAKKIYGEKSAKRYAPGQRKKMERYDDDRYDRKEHHQKRKGKGKGKKH